MYNKEEIFAKIDSYQTEMWQLIEECVNTDSSADGPEGVVKIAHRLGGLLEPLDFEVTYHESAGPLQLIAKRPRPGKPRIMIFGHMDTVFPKGTAAARPFRIENGIAYGPGVMDMRSGFCMGLYTLKAMIECGYDDADITYYLTGDEEVNHVLSDSVKVIAEVASDRQVAFNMEPAREGYFVSGRKGCWRPLIKVKGIAAHSGNDYTTGASAILELARKVPELFAITNLEEGTTSNGGTFHGGTLPNIMAENAEVKMDIRFVKQAEVERARREVEAIVAKRYDERCVTTMEEIPSDMMPCFEETPQGLALCKFVQEQYEALGYGKLEYQYVGGSSDAAYTTMAGVPTVCGMGPKAWGAHSANEYAYVDSYIPRMHNLASCIMNIEAFLKTI